MILQIAIVDVEKTVVLEIKPIQPAAMNGNDGVYTIPSVKYADNIELIAKYPNGIPITYTNGYPDFSTFAKYTVDIDLDSAGKIYNDYKNANIKAGISSAPIDWTWHHHENGKTMQLIPTVVNAEARHTGGFSNFKNYQDKVLNICK